MDYGAKRFHLFLFAHTHAVIFDARFPRGLGRLAGWVLGWLVGWLAGWWFDWATKHVKNAYR